MNILSLTVGQLQSNCYIVYDEKMKKTIIIDPGDDADYITRKMSDLKVKPELILATHGHFDHIMAATELQLIFNIPFYIHQKDEFLVSRMNETSLYFTGVEVGPPPKINGYLIDQQKILLGNNILKIIESPGHTPGSVCIVSDENMFVGDLLFADGGVGRTDFSYCSQEDLIQSIGKILSFQLNTKIYPGHGQQTSIEKEKHFHT